MRPLRRLQGRMSHRRYFLEGFSSVPAAGRAQAACALAGTGGCRHAGAVGGYAVGCQPTRTRSRPTGGSGGNGLPSGHDGSGFHDAPVWRRRIPPVGKPWEGHRAEFLGYLVYPLRGGATVFRPPGGGNGGAGERAGHPFQFGYRGCGGLAGKGRIRASAHGAGRERGDPGLSGGLHHAARNRDPGHGGQGMLQCGGLGDL